MRQPVKHLAILTIIAAVLLIPCAIANGSVDMGWGASTLTGGILRVCFSFTLGIVIYRLLAAEKLPAPKINPALLLTGLALILLTPIGIQNVYYDLFCVLIVFPAFVVLACHADTPVALHRAFADSGPRISPTRSISCMAQ